MTNFGLGPHRIPIREYEEFVHAFGDDVQESVGVAGLNSTQNASHVRAVSVSESSGLVDSQSALLTGELVPNVDTSVGPHRLPTRRYEAFDHGVVPTGVRAESQPLIDTQSSVGVQGVDRIEAASFVDTTTVQTSIPDSVVETATYEDIIDAAMTRSGALVSTVGPMGVPRQRWTDFIHPGGVQEIVSLLDLQDAAVSPEQVAFVQENAPVADTVGIGGIFNEFVEDNVALNDSATTGSTFNGTANEAASLLDITDATIEVLTVAVVEVNTLVDILVVDSIFRNALVGEFAGLYDVPGVAGELYDIVEEVAAATAAFDISGAFTPGVNIDGARTIHVAEEVRELEVMA